MKQFMKIFNKVGGKEILRQYWHAHILVFALFQTICQGFSKKSLEIVRLSASNRNLVKMRKKYKKFISEYKKNASRQESLPRSAPNKIWVCWLQGIEKAPIVVKKCYESLLNNVPEREIILLTENNYRDYVSFPPAIQDKIEKGTITRTHMSDLLRLELLIRYGGTWIDSTVFCSGRDIPEYMLNSDLFVYQCLKPGLDGHCTRISSWFMTACTNHPILLLTRELLYEYWSKNNNMQDYFLLHDFFELAIEAYPDEFKKVIPFCNSVPHIILLRIFDQYNENVWCEIKKQTPFHKITYKFDQAQTEMTGTYYDILFCD